jgi:CCR4-NOT transcription complex subunit 7/8
LTDEHGNYPPGISTWQFNFRFSTNEDMCAPDSLELLNKAGLDFDRHERLGIDVEYFGELLITSGLALFDEVRWVSFHRYVAGPRMLHGHRRPCTVLLIVQAVRHSQLSCSGYDFGYLVKVVSCAPLPTTEAEFFQLLRIWFPSIYDIKYLMRSCKNLKGGLQDVAEELGVARIGQQHQAGSDSLLTAATFFKLRSRFFEGVIDDAKFIGALYGFSASSRPLPLGSANPSSSITSPPSRELTAGGV